MKSLLFVASTLLCSVAQAQDSGTIIYEQKMDMHRNIPPDRQEMKDMMPQFNSSFFELTYAGDESIYQPRREEEVQETTTNSGGTTMTMR